MHETTVAIRKLWPPFKPGDKRTNLEDSDGNKYRIDIGYANGFNDGDVVVLSWTDEKAPAEFGGKEYKLIKKMKHADGGVRAVQPYGPAPTPPKPADIGPHLGMWEKEVFDALRAGMTSPQVIIMGIEARRTAREILKTDLDGKLPEPKGKADFNDNLGDTFDTL